MSARRACRLSVGSAWLAEGDSIEILVAVSDDACSAALSAGQGRRLLLYELVPLLTVALLAGGLVGVALPRLIGPALGLSGFTAGVAARDRIDPALIAAVLAVVALAVAAALLVESAANRRMRLGEALRLGGEYG